MEYRGAMRSDGVAESLGLGGLGFRRGLARALPEWEAEGIIAPEAAAELRSRYGLEDDASGAAQLAVYALGALLVFGGLVSFVAWNWASVPREWVLVGGVLFMLAAQITGFSIGWRGERRALGHGLLVLGALSFGANLVLVAQVLGSEPGPLVLLAWAASSAGLAVALRSQPCAALAMIAGLAWVMTQAGEGLVGGPWAVHGAWLAALGAALAWRSPALVALALGLGTAAVGIHGLDQLSLFHAPLGFAAAGIGLGLRPRYRALAPAGGAGLTVVAFVVSFGAVGEALADATEGAAFLPWASAPWLVALRAAWLPSGDDEARRIRIGLGLGFALALSPSFGPVAVAIAAHALLIARVAHDLSRSLGSLARAPFWSGLLLGVVLILARFLELEIHLLAKAAGFTVAGLAVIALGILFERRRREVHRAC